VKLAGLGTNLCAVRTQRQPRISTNAVSVPSDLERSVAYNVVEWRGAAPICTTIGILNIAETYFTSAPCEDEHPKQLTTGKQGAGGEKPCLYNAGFKSYCCKDPSVYSSSCAGYLPSNHTTVPFKNCAWHQGRSSWTAWAKSVFFQGPVGVFLNLGAPLIGEKCEGQCPKGQVPIAT
jgi:hypothetical protein